MMLRHIKIKEKLKNKHRIGVGRESNTKRETRKKREKKIFNNSTLILTRCSFLNPTEAEQQQIFFLLFLAEGFMCSRMFIFKHFLCFYFRLKMFLEFEKIFVAFFSFKSRAVRAFLVIRDRSHMLGFRSRSVQLV